MRKKESFMFWGLFLILSYILMLVTINLVVVIMMMVAAMICSPTILSISTAPLIIVVAIETILFGWDEIIDEFFF